jgi:hypothetical protein
MYEQQSWFSFFTKYSRQFLKIKLFMSSKVDIPFYNIGSFLRIKLCMSSKVDIPFYNIGSFFRKKLWAAKFILLFLQNRQFFSIKLCMSSKV